MKTVLSNIYESESDIMFTGIVDDIGTVLSVLEIPEGLKTRIQTEFELSTLSIGGSISCAGICHTVVEKGKNEGKNWFEIESASETLNLTTASTWNVGSRLNLERSLKVGDELGGHLVSGHVDGTAKVIEQTSQSDSMYLKFTTTTELLQFIAVKGSVALDGTSLTVNEANQNSFSVLLIPHTTKVTTWNEKKVGDLVNLEVDMMARYLARLTEISDI